MQIFQFIQQHRCSRYQTCTFSFLLLLRSLLVSFFNYFVVDRLSLRKGHAKQLWQSRQDNVGSFDLADSSDIEDCYAQTSCTPVHTRWTQWNMLLNRGSEDVDAVSWIIDPIDQQSANWRPLQCPKGFSFHWGGGIGKTTITAPKSVSPRPAARSQNTTCPACWGDKTRKLLAAATLGSCTHGFSNAPQCWPVTEQREMADLQTWPTGCNLETTAIDQWFPNCGLLCTEKAVPTGHGALHSV